MKSFTVHESPEPRAEMLDRAEELVFVKDGFSIFAALAAPIWMVVNRLWLVLFVYVVLLAGLELIFMGLGASTTAQSAIALGLNLLIGFEADSLKRWTLERKGWTLIGTVTGETADICERRFFEAWVPGAPNVDAHRFAGRGGSHGRQQDDPYVTATTPQAGSNLGAVVEPPGRRGWFGGWRSTPAVNT